MLFVCFAHFGEVFFQRREDLVWLLVFRRIGMIASPTFMLVSGAMLGFLWRRSAPDFGATAARLRRRAFTLLTFTHLALAAAHVPSGGLLAVTRRLFITDTVAVNLLLGTALLPRLPARGRLAAAAALFVAAFVVAHRVQPGDPLLATLEEVLTGTFDWRLSFFTDLFPLVPWFAIYLGGTVLGDRLASAREDADLRRLAPRLALAGVLGVAAPLLVKAVVRIFVDRLTGSDDFWADLVDPFQKLPPSPAYLCVFAGTGLVLLSVVFYAVSRQVAPRAGAWLASWGRQSMSVFIIQSFVYFTIYALVRPGWPWPLAFGFSLVLVDGALRVRRYASGLVANRRRLTTNAASRS